MVLMNEHTKYNQNLIASHMLLQISKVQFHTLHEKLHLLKIFISPSFDWRELNIHLNKFHVVHGLETNICLAMDRLKNTAEAAQKNKDSRAYLHQKTPIIYDALLSVSPLQCLQLHSSF